jgi:hypothetical protein
MPTYDELHQAFLDYRRVRGRRAADALVLKHGGRNGLSSVPEACRAALLVEFRAGIDDFMTENKPNLTTVGQHGKTVLDHDAIWRHWNSQRRNPARQT